MDGLAQITLALVCAASVLLACSNCTFWAGIAFYGDKEALRGMILGNNADMIGNAFLIPIEEDDVSRLS